MTGKEIMELIEKNRLQDEEIYIAGAVMGNGDLDFHKIEKLVTDDTWHRTIYFKTEEK